MSQIIARRYFENVEEAQKWLLKTIPPTSYVPKIANWRALQPHHIKNGHGGIIKYSRQLMAYEAIIYVSKWWTAKIQKGTS